MKRVFDILLVLTLLCCGGYFIYAYQTPCRLPVRYSIGALDPRFNLSTTTLVAALKDAEGLWEDGAGGSNLFEYEEKGGMPVNLVYDTRQATTQKNSQIKANIDATTGSADAVKAQYDGANARYQSSKAAYLSAQSSYDAALKAYNDKVAYWNARGGAPKSEYQSLQSQKAQLQAQASALESQRLSLNALADQVNALSARYNQLASKVNANVDAINKTAGKEFEEGLFTRTALSSKIDIFEYSSRAELVRVLAHEMGHSLGLPHNANPDSIMYELNQSKNDTPTTEDLASLKEVCGI